MYKLSFSDGSHLLVKDYPEWKSINVKGIYVTSIVYKVSSEEFSNLDTIKGYFNDESKTSSVDIFRVNDDDESVQSKVETAESYTKLQRVVMEEDGSISIYMVKGTTIPELINDLNNKVKELEAKIETLEKEKKEEEVSPIEADETPEQPTE